MDLTRIVLLFCVFVYSANGDDQCTSKGGTCQYDSNECTGWYESGLCSGPVNRRCCVPPGDDSACSSLGGQCQDDSNSCSGSYQTGLCSGPTGRRCCVPGGDDGTVTYCGDVRLVTREEWGARDPASKSYMLFPVDFTFIHHTSGRTCYDIDACKSAVRSVQNYHMDSQGWNDIGYSFLIGQDGNAYEGRGWGIEGAHTVGYNSIAHAVSFMGNFEDELPNQKAMDAAQALIDCGVARGYIMSTYILRGHRDVAATACPGQTLYDEIKTWDNYE